MTTRGDGEQRAASEAGGAVRQGQGEGAGQVLRLASASSFVSRTAPGARTSGSLLRLGGCLGVAACVSACAASSVQPATPAAEGAEARAPDALADQRLCDELPPNAWRQLQSSLEASRRHARHVWRDLPPFAADGRLNGYVEIPLGESRKWEFDIAANELRLDRTLDASLGGYPINYGFVPQTVSCDGDPFDVLVLGPTLAAGNLVTGQIVGVMYMTDEKGPDGKVIIAPSGEENALTPELQAKLLRWFDAYKKDSRDGRWSRVDGFGSAAEGRALVQRMHRFYGEGKGGSQR